LQFRLGLHSVTITSPPIGGEAEIGSTESYLSTHSRQGGGWETVFRCSEGLDPLFNPPAAALALEPVPGRPFGRNYRCSRRERFRDRQTEILIQSREDKNVGEPVGGRFRLAIALPNDRGLRKSPSKYYSGITEATFKLHMSNYDAQTIYASNPLVRFAHRNRVRRSLALALPRLGDGKLLDYGCGSGVFVSEVIARHPGCAVGYEPFMTERSHASLPIFDTLARLELEGP
jgi:hypothetical protein